jgi:hypothetical protein
MHGLVRRLDPLHRERADVAEQQHQGEEADAEHEAQAQEPARAVQTLLTEDLLDQR